MGDVFPFGYVYRIDVYATRYVGRGMIMPSNQAMNEMGVGIKYFLNDEITPRYKRYEMSLSRPPTKPFRWRNRSGVMKSVSVAMTSSGPDSGVATTSSHLIGEIIVSKARQSTFASILRCRAAPFSSPLPRQCHEILAIDIHSRRSQLTPSKWCADHLR